MGVSSQAPGRQFALLVVAGALPLALHPLRSLHFDEAFAAHAVALPWQALLNFLIRHDAHPPLFYALLKLWTGLLGDSPVALRAFSALCGVGAVWATVRLGRIAGVGFPAGAILAVSPFYLYAAAEARMYPLLTAFYALAASEVLRLRERPARFPWVLALSLVGMLYTHYLGMLLAASLVAGALWSGGRASFVRYLGALAVAAIAFSPWTPVLVAHLWDGRMTPVWRGPLPPDALLQLFHLIGFGGRTLGAAGYYFLPTAPLGTQVLLAAPVVVLLTVAASALARRDPAFGRLAAAAVGIPVVMLFGVSAWTGSFIAYPRYFSFAMPFVAVGLAALITWVTASGRLLRAVAAGLLGTVVVLSLGSLSDFSRDPTRGTTDWKAAAAFLAKGVQRGDVVAVYPRHTEVPLAYYLPGQRAAWVVLPTDWDDPTAAAARHATDRLAAGFDRLWLVTRHPMPPGGFEATLRRANRTHTVADFGDFGEVRVTLFTRRSQ